MYVVSVRVKGLVEQAPLGYQEWHGTGAAAQHDDSGVTQGYGLAGLCGMGEDEVLCVCPT